MDGVAVKLVYIAGPFRASTAWEIEQNIRRAEDAGLDVAILGAVPVIPHSMYRFYHGQCDGKFWLEATLELLRKCDAVLLLPGWHFSSGSIGEVDESRRLQIPAFEQFADLHKWFYDERALECLPMLRCSDCESHRVMGPHEREKFMVNYPNFCDRFHVELKADAAPRAAECFRLKEKGL